MGARIWARHWTAPGLATCRDGNNADWHIGINYNTLPELQTRLQAALTGSGQQRISALAIFAHGSNVEGSQLNPPNPLQHQGSIAIEGDGLANAQLHIGNLGSQTYQDFFRLLNSLMESNAILYFMACNVAASGRGRQLLMGVSRLLPGRRVVGFIPQLAAGRTRSSATCTEAGAFAEGEPADENYSTAVMALNGAIISANPGQEQDRLRRQLTDLRASLDALYGRIQAASQSAPRVPMANRRGQRHEGTGVFRPPGHQGSQNAMPEPMVWPFGRPSRRRR